jgi:hypothetical protein
MIGQVPRHNGERLVRTRIVAQVQPPRANVVVDHRGGQVVRPGQGGVVLGIDLGSPAEPWESDHLEPGASVGHPDPEVNDAVQVLSCLGNDVVVLDGPARGASGTVFGKHGAVLVAFSQEALRLLGPGEWVAIETQGVGLALEEEAEIVFHSCSPRLLDAWASVPATGSRLQFPIVAELPPEAAAAGIGMPVFMFNIDLQVDQPPIAEVAQGLRFGDIVALRDHDHRYGRQYSPGWLTLGSICHGHSIGGGHGFGFVSLATGPADRIELVRSPGANLAHLLDIQWKQ